MKPAFASPALLATLLLGACTAGPDFGPPPDPGIKSYLNGGDQKMARPEKPVEDKWWRAFKSTDLDQMIDHALVENQDIAVLTARLDSARAQVDIASSGLMPTVSVDANIARQQYGASLFGPSNFSIPPFTYYQVGPRVSYVIDLAGGEHRAIERQQALGTFQSLQRDGAAMALTGQIVMQTVTAATARSEIEIAENLIRLDDRIIALSAKRLQIGVGTRPERLSDERLRVDDETLLPRSQKKVEAADHALALLLGRAPAQWSAPRIRLGDLSLPGDLPYILPSTLAQHRPDIKAAQAMLQAANAQLGIAEAAFYPSLKLSAGLNQEVLSPESFFQPGSTAWNLLSGLTVPIFDGGRLNAQRRVAEADYRAELAQYRQTLLRAFTQIADILSALEQDDRTILAQQHAVDEATASLKLARTAQKAGADDLLGVLRAERNLLQASLGLTQATGQKYLDVAQLFAALGGNVPGPV